MKKKYKIEVDCANCAAKCEEAAKKVPGVADASVSFMTQKMQVEFSDGADVNTTVQNILTACQKVERDFQIFM